MRTILFARKNEIKHKLELAIADSVLVIYTKWAYFVTDITKLL